jgi:molecular chaperone DnaK (HSP70)
MPTSIGIDLGTTYSVVAWITPDGQPAVIPDEEGETLVPSVVSFASGLPVVGAAAKADQARGEVDVAAFFKSSMGDAAFGRSLGGQEWTAAGLSGLVLAHLKAQAEQALGEPVTEAVITVPEYFTHPQRLATIEAGTQAGLEVLRIIGEPTAAALAYGLCPGERTGRFLVYDLGGGTFDVSLVELTADSLTVVAATGDHELGGRNWDDRLALALQERFRADTGGDLLAADPGSLLVAVERLKRTLSDQDSADIQVADGATYTVTREQFEGVSADLLERTAQLASQVLGDAGVAWADIDGVLPVGGSTRMPMVREWITQMSGREPMRGIHPDQAVALGAAVQAALLTAPLPGARPVSSPDLPRLPGPKQIKDIVAHSLGMIAESYDRSRYVNSVLLRRNTPIPCQALRPYQFDIWGSDAELEVYLAQGESDNPADSTYLGRYLVTGFPPEVSGPAVIDITYSYDANAVVSVAAVERSTGTRLTVLAEELPDDVPGRFLRPPAVRTQRGPTTVYLAFDLSHSMKGQPLVEARRAAMAFASQVDLTTTAVGLIAFSDTVVVELPESQNATDIGRAIEGMSIGRTGDGNATDPFEDICGLLEHRKGRRIGVVLADGIWQDQPLAAQRARFCHEHGIDIIAIGFGHADQQFLEQIASCAQNAFFTSLHGLTETFTAVARELTESTGNL